MYQKLAEKSKNLSSFRLLTMRILGFCGFMRYFEISNLRRSDINFHDKFMKVFIEKCKTEVKLFLQALVDIRLRKEDFGLHSLRSGGAILAANEGVRDRLFKRQCRWK